MKNIYVLVMDGVYRICIWLSGISLLFMTFIYLVGIYALALQTLFGFLDVFSP